MRSNSCTTAAVNSGLATGVWEANATHFCQNGARDFFKIDEKLGRGRWVLANLQRSKGHGQRNFHLWPPAFLALATPWL